MASRHHICLDRAGAGRYTSVNFLSHRSADYTTESIVISTEIEIAPPREGRFHVILHLLFPHVTRGLRAHATGDIAAAAAE